MPTENEKQLTALMNLRIRLQKEADLTPYAIELNAYNYAISNIDDLLATERQQLIDFGAECMAEILLQETSKTMKSLSTRVYNNTFKTQ